MRKKTGAIDLTTGNEMRAIVVFALPLIAGNLFQQLYNLMDTMIVGKFIGADALAAVGSSYMTMNFLTSNHYRTLYGERDCIFLVLRLKTERKAGTKYVSVFSVYFGGYCNDHGCQSFIS